MDSVATRDPGEFGTGRLFLTDTRLLLAFLNSARYAVLQRVFGASREQTNVVTFFAALIAADAAYESARRAIRAPLGVSAADVALGGAALREAAFAITGRRSRQVPMFATLVTGAALASLAFPGLRRAAQRARAAEQRVRQQRIGRYGDALRAARS